jgi:adenylate cyclase
MGIEIERRFLVDGREGKPWRGGVSKSIFQSYLENVKHIDGKISWNEHLIVEDERELVNLTTWRIRLSEGVVTLTAKGRRIGAMATEYEWDLPLELYNSLPLDSQPSISKIRHHWIGEDGLLWEVDEFEGVLGGLIIAEVELEDEHQDVVLPSWLGLEITYLKGWSNSALSMMIKDSKLN